MNAAEKSEQFIPSASEYILDNFDAADRIAILVLNRDFGETVQRITSAQKAASPEFQAWLRYKNANGSDIYMGMNPLKKHRVHQACLHRLGSRRPGSPRSNREFQRCSQTELRSE